MIRQLLIAALRGRDAGKGGKENYRDSVEIFFSVNSPFLPPMKLLLSQFQICAEW